jgi:A/G-specific adenine glycosylase
MRYYYSFLEQFPTLLDLANAPEDQVLHCWQGLGYYSRARNLHAAAKRVRDVFQGEFPTTYEDVLSLPGIGPYTAAAVSSIAFGLPYAVVDGNVYRFLARLNGISTPIDSPAGQKEFRMLAQSLINPAYPGDFNQAMMEMGATICTPKQPLCQSCIFQNECVAFSEKTISSLPVKTQKTKVRDRYFIFLIFNDSSGNTLIERRGAGDIWTGLYQFPLIETQHSSDSFQVSDFRDLHSFFLESPFIIRKFSATVRHILSHQRLHARFLHLDVDVLPQDFFPASENMHTDDLQQRAFPRLITRYLDL